VAGERSVEASGAALEPHEFEPRVDAPNECAQCGLPKSYAIHSDYVISSMPLEPVNKGRFEGDNRQRLQFTAGAA
jgi:hypothetical protein